MEFLSFVVFLLNMVTRKRSHDWAGYVGIWWFNYITLVLPCKSINTATLFSAPSWLQVRRHLPAWFQHLTVLVLKANRPDIEGEIAQPWGLVKYGLFQDKSQRQVNCTITDLAGNWWCNRAIFGAGFDFRMIKVVTLRDHQIEASKWISLHDERQKIKVIA